MPQNPAPDGVQSRQKDHPREEYARFILTRGCSLISGLRVRKEGRWPADVGKIGLFTQAFAGGDRTYGVLR